MRYSHLNLSQKLAGILAIAILSTVVLLTGRGDAKPHPPQVPPITIAGSAPFAIGQAGININFPPGVKIPNANYAVVVQQTNTAGYSPLSDCTYFNPLHKRSDGFEVQHKRCDDGTPVALDGGVTLNWIVVEIK